MRSNLVYLVTPSGYEVCYKRYNVGIAPNTSSMGDSRSQGWRMFCFAADTHVPIARMSVLMGASLMVVHIDIADTIYRESYALELFRFNLYL